MEALTVMAHHFPPKPFDPFVFVATLYTVATWRIARLYLGGHHPPAWVSPLAIAVGMNGFRSWLEVARHYEVISPATITAWRSVMTLGSALLVMAAVIIFERGQREIARRGEL